MAKYSEGEEVCYNGTDFARVIIQGTSEETYFLEEGIGGSSMYSRVKSHWVPEAELHHLTYAQRLARIEEALDLD